MREQQPRHPGCPQTHGQSGTFPQSHSQPSQGRRCSRPLCWFTFSTFLVTRRSYPEVTGYPVDLAAPQRVSCEHRGLDTHGFSGPCLSISEKLSLPSATTEAQAAPERELCGRGERRRGSLSLLNVSAVSRRRARRRQRDSGSAAASLFLVTYYIQERKNCLVGSINQGLLSTFRIR